MFSRQGLNPAAVYLNNQFVQICNLNALNTNIYNERQASHFM